MDSIFSKAGELAKLLPDYEEREEQIVMAKAVESAIIESNHLICEAGTGIGKSLAYLVPFVKWAKENKKRVIISTYTKTLQHQLLAKDIPLLKSALGLEFNAQPAFGSENYLCLRRWHKLINKGQLFPSNDLERIAEWEAETDTGLRQELERAGRVRLFSEVAREPDLCLGKKCKFRAKCYYECARRRLFKADVIVTNHWLFFTNIVSGKRVLPPYHGTVFDEAQNLEDVATQYFGIHISNYSIDYLLNAILREIGDRELRGVIEETRTAKEEFFKRVLELVGEVWPGAESVVRIKEKQVVPNLISPKLDAISLVLKELRENTDEVRPRDEEKLEELNRYILKCKSLDTELSMFLNQSLRDGADPSSVYWVEVVSTTGVEKHRKGVRISLNSAPILVAPWMEEYVFDPELPILLTSATLTVDSSFTFFKSRIGPKGSEELLLASSFDYLRNALLYIPEAGPDPRASNYGEFVAQKVEELVKSVPESAGVLVLFTSFKLMDEVYAKTEFLHSKIKQGEMARDELLDRFREGASILFGVQSFWQGIDVPGEALSMVILTRLPFDVPDSPVTEARAEWISSQGGNPFWDYQLPQAVMQLKQGFGRLIRKKEDFGVVAILDTRIRKRAYGRKFLASLPECEITSDIQKVKHFLRRVNHTV